MKRKSPEKSGMYLHACDLYVAQKVIDMEKKMFLKWRGWAKLNVKKKKIILECDLDKKSRVLSFLRLLCRLRKIENKVKRLGKNIFFPFYLVNLNRGHS